MMVKVTFRIPRGVTGFYNAKAAPLPCVDLKRLHGAWHFAARLAGGRTGEFIEQSYPEVFHTATIEGEQAPYAAILCHAHFPVVAFVSHRTTWYETEFVDPPTWAHAYSDYGFETLSADFLLSAPEAVDLSQLSASERGQIRSWKPPTLGAILFNRWD